MSNITANHWNTIMGSVESVPPSVESTSHSKRDEVVSPPQADAEYGSSPNSSSSSHVRRKDNFVHAKRNHLRAYHSLASGAKLKHLKKPDGVPLWRADIQYDFLSSVFHNDLKVFTKCPALAQLTPGPEKCTFADLYIGAMACSSKTSRILRDKLLNERQAGLNMAMVCLLVNIGRMNTTLNFFPEMRAQLRTYHPIPSLQTYSDDSEYKQLQDAPRLKSILKGACEDSPEPENLDAMTANGRHPHTNPINLIFLMTTFATQVTAQFFPVKFEFYDLIMNPRLSSQSRARVFLWLVWAYLESELEPEQLRKNPFGDNSPRIPQFTTLTREQISLENVDNDAEKQFGMAMSKERLRYIDGSNNTGANTTNNTKKPPPQRSSSSPFNDPLENEVDPLSDVTDHEDKPTDPKPSSNKRKRKSKPSEDTIPEEIAEEFQLRSVQTRKTNALIASANGLADTNDPMTTLVKTQQELIQAAQARSQRLWQVPSNQTFQSSSSSRPPASKSRPSDKDRIFIWTRNFDEPNALETLDCNNVLAKCLRKTHFLVTR